MWSFCLRTQVLSISYPLSLEGKRVTILLPRPSLRINTVEREGADRAFKYFLRLPLTVMSASRQSWETTGLSGLLRPGSGTAAVRAEALCQVSLDGEGNRAGSASWPAHPRSPGAQTVAQRNKTLGWKFPSLEWCNLNKYLLTPDRAPKRQFHLNPAR